MNSQPNQPPPLDEVPRGTDADAAEMRRLLLAAPRDPLLPAGTVSPCHVCGKETLVTTNQLKITIATPTGLRVVTRLPGAECSTCGAKALDAGGAAILEEEGDYEIVADYETTVTTVGPMLATYLKGDLRRALGFRGKEKLRWKIMDRDHALVEVVRRGARRRRGP